MAKQPAKKKAAPRVRVTVEELQKFVREYQKASSISEVAKAMDWKFEKVQSQAVRLRKMGVSLKTLDRSSNLTDGDIEGLKALCSTVSDQKRE